METTWDPTSFPGTLGCDLGCDEEVIVCCSSTQDNTGWELTILFFPLLESNHYALIFTYLAI